MRDGTKWARFVMNRRMMAAAGRWRWTCRAVSPSGWRASRAEKYCIRSCLLMRPPLPTIDCLTDNPLRAPAHRFACTRLSGLGVATRQPAPRSNTMAWNEPGKGNKDPWGNKGQGDDVEAFLARLKANLGRVFGGSGPPERRGGGSGSNPLYWLLLIVAIWVLFDSWQIIDERQSGVVLRFGKFDRQIGRAHV